MLKCSISALLLAYAVFFTFTGVIHGQSSTDGDNKGTMDKFKEIFGQISSGMKTAAEGIRTMISGGAGGVSTAAKLIFSTLFNIATTPIRIMTTIAQTIMGAISGRGNSGSGSASASGGSSNGDHGSTSGGEGSGQHGSTSGGESSGESASANISN